MQYKEFADEKEWLAALKEAVVDSIDQNRGVVRIGLSGGKTPRPLYYELGQAKLPAERIEWYVADERCVPLDHPESNAGMVLNTLARGSSRVREQLHYFDTELPMEEALEDFALQVAPYKQTGFDVLILGIGSDGHILSLFPNIPELHETQASTVHTTTETLAVHDRLTVTVPFVTNSKQVIFVVNGIEKQHVVRELLHPTKTPYEFPAHLLMSHQNVTIYYLNEAKN